MIDWLGFNGTFSTVRLYRALSILMPMFDVVVLAQLKKKNAIHSITETIRNLIIVLYVFSLGSKDPES